MAVLGKRKAPGPSIDEQEAQEIFRRHFEAQFNPLPAAGTDKRPVDDESDAEQSEDESEWGGLSEEEEKEEDTGAQGKFYFGDNASALLWR
jgi:hypothetical protein